MSQIKKLSMVAAVAAVIVESGAKNLLFTTLVTVGTPATTAGFVYEVVQLRRARLDREAEDRKTASSKDKPPRAEAVIADGGDSRVIGAPDPDGMGAGDLKHRLTAMLIARAQFLDIYGGNPEAIPPIYHKVAQDMLAEDDRMFAKLADESTKDYDSYAAAFTADATRLHDLHQQVETLSPAQIAAIAPAKAPESAMDFRK